MFDKGAVDNLTVGLKVFKLCGVILNILLRFFNSLYHYIVLSYGFIWFLKMFIFIFLNYRMKGKKWTELIPLPKES